MKVRYGPAGTHFFDRKTGLNVLIDEMQVPEEMWSLAPRYMSFALTNACELACSFCYASKVPARLPFNDLKRWARELDQAGCLGLGFGGGEPTLYPKFVELCNDLSLNTNLAITITTHGHRFTAELAAQLQGAINFIRVSMDGIGTTYENIRGRSFSAFKEKLKLVATIAPFGINYVINDDTVKDLSRAAEFSFNSGAKEFLILPELTPAGDPALSRAALDYASQWVFENLEAYRLSTSMQGAKLMNVPALPINEPEHDAREFMHLDAMRNLKLSAFDAAGLKLEDDVAIVDAIKCLRSVHKSSNVVRKDK